MSISQEILEENEEETVEENEENNEEENEEDTQDGAPSLPPTEEVAIMENILSNSASVGDNELVLVEKQNAKSAVWSVFGYKPDEA